MITRAAVALAAVALAIYCAIALWYAGTVNYFDPAEPSVTAVAAAFGAGQPLYPALDAAERYVHVWGPVLFLTHAAALALAGASIAASKAVGAGAALLSLAALFLVLRKSAGAAAAIVACGVCALVFLAFSNVTFWTRADPLLLLAVAAGLVGATHERAMASAVILGLAMGVAVNLKVTGVMYLLPLLGVVHWTHGARASMTAAGVAVVVAASPFLAGTVSFAHYLDYLQLSAKDGLVLQKVRQNLVWAAFLTAPVVVVWWSSRRLPALTAATRSLPLLGVSMVVIALLGAKAGGGPFHLLPFVPVLAFTCVVMAPGVSSGRSASVAVFAAVALFLAVPSQTRLIRTTSAREMGRVIQELRQIADSETERRVAVGYAGTAYASYARPEIVFRTREYWLDAPAIQEHRRAGLDLPPATLARLEACSVVIWLVPRHGEAFVVPNAYFPDGPAEVFPPAFRDVFARRYEKTGATEFFDIWRCRR